MKIKYFHANCTAFLQQLDQGIIRNFKHYYRSSIVIDRLNSIENGCEDKDIDVKDAIYKISEVLLSTIQNEEPNELEDEDENAFIDLLSLFLIFCKFEYFN